MSDSSVSELNTSESLRRAVFAVALMNFAYFIVEFWMARTINSVSLFADSIDFLEDTSVNCLVLIALHMTAINRARVGKFLALLLLVPALAMIASLWSKLHAFESPAALPLTWTGTGALLVNATCAWLLARYRSHASSLMRAAFLSARNDVIANIGIIVAGGITALTHSAWPDLIVGIAIAAMNADAAKEIWEAANTERSGTP